MLMTSISCISNTLSSINISALYWVSERHKEKDSKLSDLRSLLNALRSPLTWHYCCHTHTKRFICPLTEFIKDGISGLGKVTARSVHSHTWAAFGKDKKKFIGEWTFFFVVVFCAPFTPPLFIFSPNINILYGKQSFPFSLIKISSEGKGRKGVEGSKKEPPSALGKTWEWSINLLFSIYELSRAPSYFICTNKINKLDLTDCAGKRRRGKIITSRKFSNDKKSSHALDKFLGNLKFSKLVLVPRVLIPARPLYYGFDYKLIRAHLFLGPWQVHSQHLKKKGVYMPKSSVIYCLLGSSGFHF